MKQQSFAISAVTLGLFIACVCGSGAAQQHEQFQAQAMGEGTQMGHTFAVTIIINEYSTSEEQKIMLDAFQAKGSEGISSALNKMRSKGRISITGTLGFDINYARVFPTGNGRKIRVVTDRPITFGEAWTDSRSEEYSLSALELDVDSKGKGTGILLPACQFKVNKQNELELEAFRNPWKLVDVFEWKK